MDKNKMSCRKGFTCGIGFVNRQQKSRSATNTPTDKLSNMKVKIEIDKEVIISIIKTATVIATALLF